MAISGIIHVYNESLLLSEWIKHHRLLFDRCIIIDHGSTDGSIEHARNLIPLGWEIVSSRLPDFDAKKVDDEVMEYEQHLPGGDGNWKIVLNCTEFIFTPGLRSKLKQLEEQNPEVQAFGFRSVCLVDKDPNCLEDPIWKNRNWGFVDCQDGLWARKWRYIHKAPDGQYSIGRHDTFLPKIAVPELLLLNFFFSPWPECIPRKLQIQTRIPQSDKDQRFGYQHITDQEGLEKMRQENLKVSYDLFQHPMYKEYYDRMIAEDLM